MMNYWLMKSEPSTFGILDLKNCKKQTDSWDGIRNYQARNFMRDDMKNGDLVFFYHSSCDEPGIVGTMEVVKEAYPDHTALDKKSPYYDEKASEENPRWMMVDVKLKEVYTETITLKSLKAMKQLDSMRLLQKGNRLSIMPVTEQEWKTIVQLEK